MLFTPRPANKHEKTKDLVEGMEAVDPYPKFWSPFDQVTDNLLICEACDYFTYWPNGWSCSLKFHALCGG